MVDLLLLSNLGGRVEIWSSVACEGEGKEVIRVSMPQSNTFDVKAIMIARAVSKVGAGGESERLPVRGSYVGRRMQGKVH